MEKPVSLKHVAVLGAGTMGAGIAVSLATAGYEVILQDTSAEAIERGSSQIKKVIQRQAEKGRMSSEEAVAAVARVRTTADLGETADVGLVIEAVFESRSVKQQVFQALGRVCRPGTVLASNTSTLDIDLLAAASGRAGDVVGMHFFSPAHVMRLVEVVRGRETSDAAIATALEVCRRMDKLGVVVGNCFGFVGNRMLYAYGRENQLLLLEGASPTQIDSALERFGMAMGPNRVGDLAGLDVGYRVRRERDDLPDDPRYYRVADMLVEAGRLGQKSGLGIYRYDSGSRQPQSDPDVEQLIAAEAVRLGIARRSIADEEILERCLVALVNEGARVLGEGIAQSPADIDTIWCNGYGFPRQRGGPMAYADTVGPAKLAEAIQRLAGQHGPAYWTPAPLLLELADRNLTFSAWQASRAVSVE